MVNVPGGQCRTFGVLLMIQPQLLTMMYGNDTRNPQYLASNSDTAVNGSSVDQIWSICEACRRSESPFRNEVDCQCH